METLPESAAVQTEPHTATFAAGCFWGVQYFFDHVPGVVSTEVGYAGGKTEKPSYKEVCRGNTGHAEAVHLRYDPNQISYETLVRLFFKMHNPTTRNRQGPDIGSQYRSAIFVHSAEQKRTALAVIRDLKKVGVFRHPIVTEVAPAGEFWPAETYHQDYFKKNPGRVCHITFSPSMLEEISSLKNSK